MQFIKMHGTGNDYVYVDCFERKVKTQSGKTMHVKNPSRLARAVSHRHFGVGADGLILIKPFEKGHGEMEMYNSDGSPSEMCGNGLRCVAKYLHDTYYPGEKMLDILTGNGVLRAEIIADVAGKAERVKINMGKPIFEGLKIPTTLDMPRVFQQTLEVRGQTYTFSSVSMGNPHCVIFVEDVASFPVETVGPEIERHPLFPSRVNVEFVQLVSPGELIQRTWERGSGETWACGTGACAVAVVSHLSGKTESDVVIHLKGGDLELSYKEGDVVWMTGNAVEVYRGEWPEGA